MSYKDWFSKIVMTAKRYQFGAKQQLAFLEDLYALINDGIPASRAVEMMSEVTTGITHEVSTSISAKIAQGQPLAEGMREWFASNVVEIIRVGEAGGALAQTLKSAINMLSQQGVAYGAFIGAIAYPVLVLVIACGVIIYLNDSILTQFTLIKPMEQWPSAGRELVALGNLIKDWWWLFICALIAIFFILKYTANNYIGEYRQLIDMVPPFTFYRQFAAARLLETLGLLVENGVVFKSAITVMQYQANPYMGMHLSMMEHLLSMGKTNIADVLDTGLISKPELMRLRVMAEVKGFEHGLVRMGLRGADQVTQTLKLISRIIGGIFLAVDAYIIVTIIKGIYLTGMSLT